MQGKFAEVVKLHSDHPFFKTIMFDLPHKQLSFLMRGCADVLPSFANLRRWGKVLSDRCALCPWRETTHHVLNCCKKARDQERFNLRHDSILQHVVKQILAGNPEKRVIADLEGHRLPDGGTVPPELMVTNLRPDLVLIDPITDDIELFDLTSCADREENINGARIRKSTKYAPLVADLEQSGHKASFTPFEVCSLGNIRSDTRKTLTTLVGRKVAKRMMKKLAMIAVASSYYIFNNRRNTEWHSPPLFEKPVD